MKINYPKLPQNQPVNTFRKQFLNEFLIHWMHNVKRGNYRGMATGYFANKFNTLSSGLAPESPSATQTHTHAETLGFKTTMADMPKVDTSSMMRHSKTALTDAQSVRQNITAGRTAIQNFQASFTKQHEIALREVNDTGNKVAAEMGLDPYAAMRSIAPKAQATTASVAAGAMGGVSINVACMAADLVGERKALTPGEAQQFISRLHDALAEKAHAAQEQVKLGTIPDGQQKPMMKWDKMKPEEFAEFVKTPVTEQPEMKVADATLTALKDVEQQLDMAEANAKYSLTADKVAAALERGDVKFIEKAFKDDPQMVQTEIKKALKIDPEWVKTLTAGMGESLPYGLEGILYGHAYCGDLALNQKILNSIPKTGAGIQTPSTLSLPVPPNLMAPTPPTNNDQADDHRG